jgi:hypothetical protein
MAAPAASFLWRPSIPLCAATAPPAAPIAPQVAAPTRAAWFFVIPVQPERKKPTAANASCLFRFITASQQGPAKIFWPKYYTISPKSSKKFVISNVMFSS